jgi:hypothetical protein
LALLGNGKIRQTVLWIRITVGIFGILLFGILLVAANDPSIPHGDSRVRANVTLSAMVVLLCFST